MSTGKRHTSTPQMIDSESEGMNKGQTTKLFLANWQKYPS